MARRFRRFLKVLLTFAILAAVLYLSRPWWLRGLGHALVHDDGPARSDIAVVLAGDFAGTRILKAADLVRQGAVPVALVDGPPGIYGINEATLAIQFIVAKGNPPDWFIPFPIHATSTREEAYLVIPELQRRHIHSYLLVTSDFHSGRARRIFLAAQRALGCDAVMRTVAAHSSDFNADTWWHSREGRKGAFTEWCKTIATALGL